MDGGCEEDALGPSEAKLAGKKRPRKQSESLCSDVGDDAECGLGDEDFFYGGAPGCPVGTLHNNVVKLNEQEEMEMIRELENQAIGADPLKELDEALKDRVTA